MSTNGPPTPPLEETPEVEKSVVPAEPSAPPASTESVQSPTAQNQAEPPQAPPEVDDTVYHNIFPTLVSLGADRNYRELINTAESFDLRFENDAEEARFLLIAPLVLSYLIIDNLPPARYAITRLPHPLFVHPLSQALFGLLAATWERNHAQVYARSNALVNLVNDAPNLSGLIPPMITTFIDAFRLRTINLISKAYTSITLLQAEIYLGLPKNELLTVVAERNWSYDEVQQILMPARPQPMSAKHMHGSISAPSSLLTFDVVADGVVMLEA